MFGEWRVDWYIGGMSWQEYYAKHKGRKPRPLYFRARLLAEAHFQNRPLSAVDLGSGAGIEACDLVANGWLVLAVDKEADALTALKTLIPEDRLSALQSLCRPFEEITQIPASELVVSFHSLPFCEAAHFDNLWATIRTGLRKNGVFVGTFFGPNDEWVRAGKVTGVTEEKLKAMLSGFKVHHYKVMDAEGPTATGGPKHWHVFEVIAQKE